MALDWSLKRAFLRTLIIALVSSALVGIYTFLFGDFGETEAKILLTTLSISYFSVTSLACAAALERKADNILAAAGLIVSVIGFLVFMPGIWAEWWDTEAVAKTMVILAIFAFSIAQICLLGLVSLSVRWVLYATTGAILALATLGSGMILIEGDDQWLLRLLGVLGILDGCGSLLIPVLAKLNSGTSVPIEGGQWKHVELTCPSCGHQDTYPIGTFHCAACPLEIRVEIHGKPNPLPPKGLAGKMSVSGTA